MPRTHTSTYVAWRPEEDALLAEQWGRRHIDQIAADLGRSLAAVAKRAQDRGLGNVRKNRISLGAFCKKTGYSRGRVATAVAKLGLKLRRLVRTTLCATRRGRRPIVVSPEQQAKILTFLASLRDGDRLYTGKAKHSKAGEWGTGRKPGACLKCRTSSRPHRARGLCGACWQETKRKTKRLAELAEKGPTVIDPARLVYVRRTAPVGLWGVCGRPSECRCCGTTQRAHFATGACKRCYYSPSECAARAARRAA